MGVQKAALQYTMAQSHSLKLEYFVYIFSLLILRIYLYLYHYVCHSNVMPHDRQVYFRGKQFDNLIMGSKNFPLSTADRQRVSQTDRRETLTNDLQHGFCSFKMLPNTGRLSIREIYFAKALKINQLR